MKIILPLFLAALLSGSYGEDRRTFTGSTPAHPEVRNFLGIPLADSIDFIRWKVLITDSRFELHCQYGLSKAGTPGFTNGKRVNFEGRLKKDNNTYTLSSPANTISLIEVNQCLLHFADHDKKMLVGNGGYSYVLNSLNPVLSDGFTLENVSQDDGEEMAFEGRTPCRELSDLLHLDKSDACIKLKWYILFFTDPATGTSSYYMKGSAANMNMNMERGTWVVKKGRQGRIIYEITPENKAYTLYFLKGDDNILFFTDPEGRLLIGNENFSFTLNRRDRVPAPVTGLQVTL